MSDVYVFIDVRYFMKRGINNMDRAEIIMKVGDRMEAAEIQTRDFAEGLVHSLVEERHRQGKTQQDIADYTGLKTPNVARVESCKYMPTLNVLIRYANALGMQLKFDLVKADEEG